jgi:hypothetical protein
LIPEGTKPGGAMSDKDHGKTLFRKATRRDKLHGTVVAP